jgi:hypothetical protein
MNSIALKGNLNTLSTCSIGTRDCHSTYSLMLRTAVVVIVCNIMALLKYRLLILYANFYIQIFQLVRIYEDG